MAPTLLFAVLVIRPSSALPFLPLPSLLKLRCPASPSKSASCPPTKLYQEQNGLGRGSITMHQSPLPASKAARQPQPRCSGPQLDPHRLHRHQALCKPTNGHHHRTGGSGTVPAARAPCTPLRTVCDSEGSRPGRQLHRNPSSKARSEPLSFPNQ